MRKILLTLFAMLFCFLLVSCKYDREVPFLDPQGEVSTLETDVSQVAQKTEDKVEYTKISFLGAGDNIVYFGTVRDAGSMAIPGGRKYNFKPIYSEVAELIENADVSFINQETLMCGEGYSFTYYPAFNGPQDMGHDLVELGFDIVGLANNHMLDKGSVGLAKTIAFWDTLPVTTVGGYKNEEDYNNIRVYEKDGIKIAVLAYTEMTNGYVPSKNSDIYVPYLNEADIEGQVKAAKEKADIVMVSVHWGEEGYFKPWDRQRNCAQRFADCGVDVVIGHHPHVIEPVEWITGKNGNKMLCYYSLGNFMAEQAYSYNMVGGMASFDIVKNGSKVSIQNAKFIPTVFDWGAGFYNNKVYLLEKYTAEQAKTHGIGAYGRYTSLAQLRGYVSSTISDEFLTESYLNSLN